MAKFRSNHHRQSKGLFSGGFKLMLVLAFGVVILLFSRPFIDRIVKNIYRTGPVATGEGEAFYLPDAAAFPLYYYQGFTLAYDEEHEQPKWVAYELNIAHLNAAKVPRTDYFEEDPRIRSGSATFNDYKNSGYTKGHLVPAADRAYSRNTMEETFLMSNISPQVYACNGGIWRELEEQVRDWARMYRSVYIVSGPLFSSAVSKHIGENRVAVPDAFFKVILDHLEPEIKGIGFVIPNQRSDQPLQHYMVSIDEIEEKSGIDFFHELFTDKLEDSIESQFDETQWTFDEERFQQRLNYWNNR